MVFTINVYKTEMCSMLTKIPYIGEKNLLYHYYM